MGKKLEIGHGSVSTVAESGSKQPCRACIFILQWSDFHFFIFLYLKNIAEQLES